MIMDIGIFELELENAFKEMQKVSTKLRELVALRADAYVAFPCVEDFKIEIKDLSVKHACCVEERYIELCESLECKNLSIKLPCWMDKELLSLWKYNGKTENLVKKIVCGLTSFWTFFDFVERCWNLYRECDEKDFFADVYKIIRFKDECVDLGDELWRRHKEKFYKFLVLDSIHIAIGQSCIDGAKVYLDCCVIVDYILKKFKDCCENYGRWRIDIVLDEEKGRL